MKKGFIGVGHGGSDSGAVANKLKEADINLVISKACRDKLEEHNLNILLSRNIDENDPLQEEIKECNKFNPLFAIDVHCNAGGGDGFEVFHHHKGGNSKKLAMAIEKRVIELGQNSRGCKTRLNSQGNDYYGFIRETIPPAIIVECAFLDSIDRYIIDEYHEQVAFGEAIAYGILDYLNIPIKEIDNTTKKSGWRVSIGYFEDINNAKKKQKEARSKGIDASIVPYEKV
ncbi:MAG: N-acetylmuramoyl-L-alanine amidase family protein [Sarcina sp.]